MPFPTDILTTTAIGFTEQNTFKIFSYSSLLYIEICLSRTNWQWWQQNCVTLLCESVWVKRIWSFIDINLGLFSILKHHWCYSRGTILNSSCFDILFILTISTTFFVRAFVFVWSVLITPREPELKPLTTFQQFRTSLATRAWAQL